MRLYDRLFTVENPGAGDTDFLTQLNPASLEVVTDAKIEPSLATATPGARYQFERLGYFCVDIESKAGGPVFNRTVGLRDSWAKAAKGADARNTAAKTAG